MNLIRPVSHAITQSFGANASFYQKYGLKGHEGVDFGSPSNSPVKAAASGIVVFSGNGGNYGNYIEIRHPDGTTTGYAHLSTLGVRVGQDVTQGQVIGKTGSTGLSTGPHLHFNYRTQSSNNGYLGGVDPMPYIKEGDEMDRPTEKQVIEHFAAYKEPKGPSAKQIKHYSTHGWSVLYADLLNSLHGRYQKLEAENKQLKKDVTTLKPGTYLVKG